MGNDRFIYPFDGLDQWINSPYDFLTEMQFDICNFSLSRNEVYFRQEKNRPASELIESRSRGGFETSSTRD